MAIPQTTQAPPPAAPTPPPTARRRRRFTVDEYHRMAEAGILREDERVELLDGDVVEMSPVGDRHVEALNRCNRRFVLALGERAVVSPQNPVRLDPHNEPQPDLAVARPDVVGAPRLGEILLAVEIADSSVDEDRADKVLRYARAGVPETWLLNALDGELEVYREPGPGGYARTFTLRPDRQVACEAFPDIVLRVADLLPPPGMERFIERAPAPERAPDPTRERDWELER
jgi:Uma2 family endonuclease